jgi:hypothetical protein
LRDARIVDCVRLRSHASERAEHRDPNRERFVPSRLRARKQETKEWKPAHYAGQLPRRSRPTSTYDRTAGHGDARRLPLAPLDRHSGLRQAAWLSCSPS